MHKLTIESQKNKSSRYDTFSEENMSSAGRTGKEYVTNYKTYISGKSLETTMSNLIHPNSEKNIASFYYNYRLCRHHFIMCLLGFVYPSSNWTRKNNGHIITATKFSGTRYCI